jgi:hypothetical protein
MANKAHRSGVPASVTLNRTRIDVVVGASSRRGTEEGSPSFFKAGVGPSAGESFAGAMSRRGAAEEEPSSFEGSADFSAGALFGMGGAASAVSARRLASTRTSLTMLDFHQLWGRIADEGGDGIDGVYRLSESIVGVMSTGAVDPKLVSITWPFRKLVKNRDVVLAAARQGFECWEWQTTGKSWAKSKFCGSSLVGQGDEMFATCNCTKDGLYAPIVDVSSAQKLAELRNVNLVISGPTCRKSASQVLALSLSWLATMVCVIVGGMVWAHGQLGRNPDSSDLKSRSCALFEALLGNIPNEDAFIDPKLRLSRALCVCWFPSELGRFTEDSQSVDTGSHFEGDGTWDEVESSEGTWDEVPLVNFADPSLTQDSGITDRTFDSEKATILGDLVFSCEASDENGQGMISRVPTMTLQSLKAVRKGRNVHHPPPPIHLSASSTPPMVSFHEDSPLPRTTQARHAGGLSSNFFGMPTKRPDTWSSANVKKSLSPMIHPFERGTRDILASAQVRQHPRPLVPRFFGGIS